MKAIKKFIGPLVVLFVYVALSFWRTDLAVQSSQDT